MSPTYNVRTEKCESVFPVNQTSSRLNLLDGRFTKLGVGMKRSLLRTGSMNCKGECWNSSINRAGLNGRGQCFP